MMHTVGTPVCTAPDGVLLGFCHTLSVWFPADPMKLETPSTYISFDLLYRNGTKTSIQFSPIQGLPRALAQVSTTEADKVYRQWPVSFLVAYGTVPYNNRRLLLVELEVGLR
jgi:hypothetical protein